jgi:hypothetical protein
MAQRKRWEYPGRDADTVLHLTDQQKSIIMRDRYCAWLCNRGSFGILDSTLCPPPRPDGAHNAEPLTLAPAPNGSRG